MKKLFLLAVLVLASFNANAQFFTGLAFDIKWANDGYTKSSGENTRVNNAYGGSVSPQLGYQFNPNLMVGARLNLLFDKSYYTETDEKTQIKTNYVMSSIGWDVAPFCRYRIAHMGKNDWFSIWADLHAYYGVMYPRSVQESGYVSKEFNRKYIYGIQAMPALGFRINEKSTLFVNFAILSLAYAGTTTKYDDRTEYVNRVVLFTGKISGLATALTSEGMYGIKLGMIRTF